MHDPRTSEISVHTYCISGIPVHIYGLDQLLPLLLLPTCRPSLAVLHTLHPRLDTHSVMSPIIRQCLAEHYFPASTSASPPTTTGLLGISFDQRNHGCRETTPLANLAFTSPPPPHPRAHEPNPTHALDMLGIYAGTTLDLGLIIDFLPSYLEFHYNPPTPRAAAAADTDNTAYIPVPPITEHIALGVSLGGHAAHLAVLHLPKITSAVVVIGCPDYPALLLQRLKQCKITGVPGYLPREFMHLISAQHPTPLPPQPPITSSPLLTSPHVSPVELLAGKKILVLGGKKDRLVPPELGRAFIEGVRREAEQVGGELYGTGTGIREVLFEGCETRNFNVY